MTHVVGIFVPIRRFFKLAGACVRGAKRRGRGGEAREVHTATGRCNHAAPRCSDAAGNCKPAVPARATLCSALGLIGRGLPELIAMTLSELILWSTLAGLVVCGALATVVWMLAGGM